MRLSTFLGVGLAATAAIALAQSRTDEWDANTARGTAVDLRLLPDGGCVVAAMCGRLVSADGGVTLEGCSEGPELQGANRTTCLQILEAGGKGWVKKQRFTVTGGF